MANDSTRKAGFAGFLRALYWELSRSNGQFEFVQFFVSQIPGILGNTLRRRLYRRFFGACGEGLEVHPGVRFYNANKLLIGANVGIGLDCTFQAGGEIVIHDRVAFGAGCKVWSVNHHYEDPDKPLLAQGYDLRKVEIGPDVWLAANVFLMPGVELGEGCIVSAGTVVSAKKYPAYSIIAGNPARVIGNRKSAPLQKSEGGCKDGVPT